jgi:signal transduction histidine kinase
MSSQGNEKASGVPIRSHRAGAWTRQVAAELGAVLIDTLGLAATVEWHVHQFQKCTGILYDLTVEETTGVKVPEEHAGSIFDMLHAALNDVARRARASRVSIALTIAPREVTMVMQHDGSGISRELPRIRTRAQAHHGICEVAGTPNNGTRVTVILPLTA